MHSRNINYSSALGAAARKVGVYLNRVVSTCSYVSAVQYQVFSLHSLGGPRIIIAQLSRIAAGHFFKISRWEINILVGLMITGLTDPRMSVGIDDAADMGGSVVLEREVTQLGDGRIADGLNQPRLTEVAQVRGGGVGTSHWKNRSKLST